jgi:hypothetical protein
MNNNICPRRYLKATYFRTLPVYRQSMADKNASLSVFLSDTINTFPYGDNRIFVKLIFISLHPFISALIKHRTTKPEYN